MTQLAIAKLGTQANKGRKQTNCRGTALEILDQSTARKTRHQTQDHNKTRQEDRQRRAKQNRNRADETGQSDSQEAKRPKSKTPKRRVAMKGEQKGARVLNTGSQPERGRTTRGESGAEGNSYQPTTQYQGGEALTVLSQSTARKVRYLQVPGGRLDRC